MNSFLKQIITPMNIGFGVLMLGLFLISLKKMISKPKESTTIPNLIAGLGIIGTFLGIFMGLLQFDTINLDKSIPKLLEGMRTAFFTSLVGLVLSNILKSFQSKKIKEAIKNEKENVGEVSLEKIATLMFEMKEAIVQSNKQVVEAIVDIKENTQKTSEISRVAIESLVQELTGDKPTSLVGQMKILRESMIKAQENAQERLNLGLENMGSQLDNLVKTNNAISTEIERGNNVLIEEFRIFAKNMAENNMKAFTEAIQECIRDLNNQLQEQFGENFKHLNYAVEKLLEWQVHYKETIEKTNDNQIELYNGMMMARDLIVEINERSSSIVEIANKLGDKIVTFDTQQQNLNNSIEVLNKISLEARELIPNIDVYMANVKENIVKSTNNIEQYIIEVDSKLLEHTELATEKITNHVVTATEKSLEEVNKSSANILDKITLVNHAAISKISKLSDSFEEQSLKTIEHITNIQNSLKSTSDVILNNFTEVAEKTSKNIDENNAQIISVRNSIKELTYLSTESIKKQQVEVIAALKDLTVSITGASELNIKAMENQIVSIEKAIVRFENEGFTLTKKISDNIQVMVENNNSNVQTSVEHLNKTLGVTLNTSLESLGNQLAAISEKFVSDYTPLTIELQKLINLAKKVG
ncbi:MULTISPECIES: hypothetical protein [unclassified Cetobacterium]|uniref:hypothetical protein n=1 Tax=unclassified Cetobacterium TaxID=2630983 RepID=UPI000647DB71|nr:MULTISPECIES: hypothetical protein [unclassified Cetobacterium]